MWPGYVNMDNSHKNKMKSDTYETLLRNRNLNVRLTAKMHHSLSILTIYIHDFPE